MITYLKHPRLNHPQLLAAWPGMGFVAFRTVSYLLESLAPERFAFINPADYFSVSSVMVDEGLASIPSLPEGSFYYWKNPLAGGDLVFFLGDSQPSPRLQLKLAREIVALAKSAGIKRVYTFAASPSPVQHKDRPRVWGVANSPSARSFLLKNNVPLLQQGQISGLNGLLLGAAAQERLAGICLLGDIPYYTVNLENPRVARAILEVMEKLIPVKIDYFHIDQEIQHSDREISQMGKKAQESMASFLQADDYGEPELEEDEYGDDRPEEIAGEEEEGEAGPEDTGPLPEPARRRIEDLFRRVKGDISQASILKKELDRWGVYREYEDRFLDLFRDPGSLPDN